MVMKLRRMVERLEEKREMREIGDYKKGNEGIMEKEVDFVKSIYEDLKK